MIFHSTFACIAFVISACAAPVYAADSAYDVEQTLQTYCVSCHGEEKQKGDQRFDQLQFPIKDAAMLEVAQGMIDQLELKEMPPKKAKAHPEEGERMTLIKYLRGQTLAFHQTNKRSGGETVLRRLNRREYRNTVRDLLQLNMQMFDPTQRFPRDLTTEHFDNVGSTLVTSGYLLEQYLLAADQVIERALSPEQKPEVKSWTFTGPFEQQQELNRSHAKAYGSKFLAIHETINSDKHWGEYAPILKFQQGVPESGYYEVNLLLEAKNKHHPWKESQVSIDKDEPMLLGIVPGNRDFGELHHPQPFEEVLAEVKIPDGKPKWHSSTVWLDQGFAPRFIYINGPARARSLQSSLGLRMLKKEGKDNKKFGNHYVKAMTDGQLPHIRIHEIEIRGPFYDQWPSKSHQAILGDKNFSPERSKEIVTAFAKKAYRREATAEEIERVMKVAERSRASGRSPYEAMKDSLKAVLCAPGFLYLNEKAAQPGKAQLSDRALVNRLAYFLWSSMPDERLLAAADDHSIRKPEVLQAEVLRMLQDVRSQGFYEGFPDSWLALRDLGGMPPDRRSFSVYYEKNLKPLMLEETRLFVRYLMEENLSLVNFLDSDFTFANKTLAKFYGLPAMKGYEFQKVALTDKRRGGLLGQASVLTVTANGIETSPVTRGVWVLENIFGTPPSPPPDDVEVPDPDTRGTKTVREQLAKHRNVPVCNECHQKIDPPGFALENFGPIGKWRTKYRKNRKVDATGVFSDGQTFEDIIGMKKVLLQRQDRFARTLIEKLLVYGTGRKIEATDRPEIDRLVAEVKEKDYRLRDALMLVVGSEVFQSK